jgi:hypothetical protein
MRVSRNPEPVVHVLSQFGGHFSAHKLRGNTLIDNYQQCNLGAALFGKLYGMSQALFRCIGTVNRRQYFGDHESPPESVYVLWYAAAGESRSTGKNEPEKTAL